MADEAWFADMVRLRRAGRFAEACQSGHAALDALRASEQPDPRTEVQGLLLLARLHQQLGEVDACKPLLAEALDRTRGPEWLGLRARSLHGLGSVRLALGRYGQAEKLLTEALALGRFFRISGRTG